MEFTWLETLAYLFSEQCIVRQASSEKLYAQKSFLIYLTPNAVWCCFQSTFGTGAERTVVLSEFALLLFCGLRICWSARHCFSFTAHWRVHTICTSHDCFYNRFSQYLINRTNIWLQIRFAFNVKGSNYWHC